MTSPRTPRQWAEGSEEPPADVTRLRGASGEDDVVRCGTGWWIVAPGEAPVVPDSFADGFRWRAGASIPTRLWPLSEVLPETPEPPREDEARTWRQGDPEPGIDVTAVRHSNSQTFVRLVVTTEHAGFPLSTYSYWRAGIGKRLSWEELTERLHGHTLTEVVPASQSVPTVPVSSTGGKETGEAAETATEALNALAALIDPDAWTANRSDQDTVGAQWQHTDRRRLSHAAAARILAAGWRPPLPAQVEIDDEADAWYVRILDVDVHHTTESAPVNLDWTRDGRLVGVELLGPLKRTPSPLPDSETEWGWQPDPQMPQGVITAHDEQAARDRASAHHERKLMRREVGPWTEVQP